MASIETYFKTKIFIWIRYLSGDIMTKYVSCYTQMIKQLFFFIIFGWIYFILFTPLYAYAYTYFRSKLNGGKHQI